ncbi:MAG: phosphoglycerate kinase [Candidatus Peribacteraceae bacterium]|nr:phosphoglycerate kinase [Candidatus Peribacteraceae bacterium]
MKLKTLSEAQNLQNARVLVRTDFNTPIKNGKVTNDTRIRVSLPTIKFLQKAGAKIILLTHLGRPKGSVDDKLRLDPVAQKLSELLKVPVKKLNDCVGPEVEEAVKKMKIGEIVLLENTRFHTSEKDNDIEFTKQLARLGDIFVDDAFGVAHRAHASNFGLAKLLPSYAGFSLEKEIISLAAVLQNPKRPLTLVLGGAKIDTKIGVLKKFTELADTILLGGGIANTFLAAQGFEVGESLYEVEKLDTAREILMAANTDGCKFVLPSDLVCIDAATEISAEAKTLTIRADRMPPNLKALDIGERSIQQFSEIIKKSGTVVWNGPVGFFEISKFELGTRAIAKACESTPGEAILGGGDTLAALAQFEISAEKFAHVSTGGGAMLEFLEGKKLPAIEILKK